MVYQKVLYLIVIHDLCQHFEKSYSPILIQIYVFQQLIIHKQMVRLKERIEHLSNIYDYMLNIDQINGRSIYRLLKLHITMLYIHQQVFHHST